jgi:hypothetical protein
MAPQIEEQLKDIEFGNEADKSKYINKLYRIKQLKNGEQNTPIN